ncbi:MAG: mismatch-specific DNA-glycosylase [Acidimicrobiales bacterium]
MSTDDARRLPLALADLHRGLAVGRHIEVSIAIEGGWGRPRGRRTSPCVDLSATRRLLVDLVAGAGFELREDPVRAADDPTRLQVVRARTLADTVGPGMTLLVCGINPSWYSADAGVGYARPGNRFWPAMLAAGLVDADRDPRRALLIHGMGMTDFVKRPTRTAAEVEPAEYRAGMERVERLVRWLQPGAVCFTGMSGWRSTVDPRAMPGPQPERIGGRPVHLVPSTSGRNARTPLKELTAHFRKAAALADAERGL